MGENELNAVVNVEKAVTTKELAETLGVSVDTVSRAASKVLDPSAVMSRVINGGKSKIFTEQQATLIMQEIQKHHNLATRQADSVTTQFEVLQKIQEGYSLAMQMMNEYKRRAEMAENSLLRLADAKGEKTVKEAAKILGFGEKNFFALMRGMGIFFYDNGINLPKQKYINEGYFFVKTENYTRNGEEYTYTRIFVTAKGLVWLEKKTKTAALEEAC